jgi:hypothetical protein
MEKIGAFTIISTAIIMLYNTKFLFVSINSHDKGTKKLCVVK